MSTPIIYKSVGDWKAGAINRPADVETIQKLLQAAAMKTGKKAFDPKGVDGKIARPPRTSATVKAIKAFQASFIRRPDMLIEPKKTT